MIVTIRPTMSLVRDLLPGMKESWIFNDCAIGETRYGEFIGLVVVRLDGGDVFYGFIPKIHPENSGRTTIDTLDIVAENFRDCPDIFDKEITWANVKEGHRYA